MIEFFCIVSEGGRVLWSEGLDSHRHIANRFLDMSLHGRLDSERVVIESVEIRWLQDQGIVFILGMDSKFGVEYADKLLERTKNCFPTSWETEFSQQYREIIRELETEAHRSFDAEAKRSRKKGQPKQGKTSRKWGDTITKEEAMELDFSVGRDNLVVPEKAAIQHAFQEVPELQLRKQGTFLDRFRKELDSNNMSADLDALKEHLVSKNVALQIGDQICKRIRDDLAGKQIGLLEKVHTLVKECAEEIIRQILIPAQDFDLFEEIDHNQAKPFVVVFVGVNGVGKSTNLAKVCFWALQKKHKVLISACDTFRSGAVEQLRKHVESLGSDNVELYERGYGKDAAKIARESIEYAKNRGIDLVLVDTAGRMQNNGPLMNSLAKLVTMASPNRLVFVGEALAGNEAMDQLLKFNEILSTHANRKIDGIILSKFDTVDDKVGAALTMAYVSKAPVIFVGTGQNYMDLRRLNTRFVVESLLG